MNIKFKISFLAIITMIAVSSCKKDDNSIKNQTTTLNSNAEKGTWKVSSYIDSGTNETSHFTDYVFQFNSGGSVNATKNGSTINGTWSTGTDDSKLKFILNFGNATILEELNDDWHVVEQNATTIKLDDVSGGNGGTDYLTFEKL